MIKKMRRSDKPLKKQGTFSCTVLLLSSVFLLMTSCAPAPELPDYGLFENLRDYSIQTFEGAGLLPRSDTPDIFTSEYILDLKGLIRLVFGAPQLEVHLFLYESPEMAAGSLNMFEVPPNSDNYVDFAFSFRPSANLRAPLVHGDVGKAMGGMDGSFSMDFYNLDKEALDLDEFFGDQLVKINQALDLVEPYQRQGEDRGKYIEHLKDYSSIVYRIEIDESYIPEDTEEARKDYHDAALEAYKLYMDAYFTALSRLEGEDAVIEGNKAGIDAFIDTLYEEDFAATMGKQLFGSDFDTYYLDGFWRDGYYGPGL